MPRLALLGRPDRHAIWTGDHWIHLDGPVPWKSHLSGAVLAGACYGGCETAQCLGWDIDEHEVGADAAAATLALLEVLRGLGIRFPFVTTSKSGRGVHVRVLLDRPWSCDAARAFAVWIRARVNRPAEMCAVIPAGSRTEKGSGAVFGLPFSSNRAVSEGGGVLLDPETLAPVPTAEALALLPEWPLVDPSELPAAPPLPARALADGDSPEPAPEAAVFRARRFAETATVGAAGSPEHRTLAVAMFAWSLGLNPDQRRAVLEVYNARRPEPWSSKHLDRLVAAPATLGRERGWRLAFEASVAAGCAPAPGDAAEPTGFTVRLDSLHSLSQSLRTRKKNRHEAARAASVLTKILAQIPLVDSDTDRAQVKKDLDFLFAELVRVPEFGGRINVPRCIEQHFGYPNQTDFEPAEMCEMLSVHTRRAALHVIEGGGSAAPQPDAVTGRGLVLQHEDTYWLRLPSGDYSRGSGLSAFKARLNETYGGLELEPKEIRSRLHVVEQVVRDYSADRVTWDLESRTVSEGVPLDPTIIPERDPEVEAWLTALVGPDDLHDLEQQIAACHPRWLDSPSHATAIVGPHTCGKSVLACGLARIWGPDATPVSLSDVVAQFNGPMGVCPIWLADEKIPPALTGEEYRTLVQQRNHRIELKGREKFVLRGCGRIIIAVNSPDALTLPGDKSSADVDAIEERMSRFECPAEGPARKALEVLKVPGNGSKVDLARLARHFRWLQETVQPEPGRFVGAPTREAGRETALRAELDQAPEIWNLVREYLAEPDAWEQAYYPDKIPPDRRTPERGHPRATDGRRCWPFTRLDGRIAIDPTAIGVILGRDVVDVRKAAKPALGPRVSKKVTWGVWHGYLLTERAVKCLAF